MDIHGPKVDREMLTRPFDQDQIKSRQVGGGRVASYLSVSTVVNRLNEAAPEWNFEVRKEWSDGNNIKALVRLEIPGMGSREHVGVMELGGNQGADAIAKGAVSDALKKAASLFGLGSELYDDHQPQQQNQGWQPQHQQDYKPYSQRPENQGYQQAPQQPQQQNQGGGYQQQQQAPQQQRQQYPQGQQQGGGGNYDNSQPVQYNPNNDSGEMRTDPQARKLGFELGDKGMGITEASNQSGIPVAGDSTDTITKRQATALIDWLTRQESKLNRQPQQQGQGGGYQQDDMDMNQVPF